MRIRNIFCTLRYPLSYIYGKRIKNMLLEKNVFTKIRLAGMILHGIVVQTIQETFDIDLARRL